MTVQEMVEQFGALSKEDQKAVLRGILPGFCESMMGDPKRILEMHSLFTEQCGEQMATMVSMMGVMMSNRKDEGCEGGCCG
jgi:hypothetical protein